MCGTVTGGCDKEASRVAGRGWVWFEELLGAKYYSHRWAVKSLGFIAKISNHFTLGHPYMRLAYCTAAIVLAGGFLLTSVSAGWAQEGEKPAEKAEEQKPPEENAKAKEGEQKSADQAKAEAAARALAEIKQYREAAATLSPSAGAAECVWTGRRVASLLWRDDMDTALRYIGLYDRFGCSSQHLKMAFRCMIEQGPMDPKAQDKLAARVQSCWLDPQGVTTAASRPNEDSTARNGTIPN